MALEVDPRELLVGVGVGLGLAAAAGLVAVLAILARRNFRMREAAA
jgi:hypothetical protein